MKNQRFEDYKRRMAASPFAREFAVIARIVEHYPEDYAEAAVIFHEFYKREFAGRRKTGVFAAFVGISLDQLSKSIDKLSDAGGKPS